ncbi:hypothetical protein BO86DRAFT_44761 [Aspergillus japonicus CBS 114.51]|uniref:Uncharacterized protein n=1 Tax=Aspergillus japonicus CBS 114.51 TaxID=1448312 RepID=A0A8T8WKC5_ASPJA|nr:hypothetical protein BO86DRAFT_44761 [Aspergillus japonicus CBS 114.51]RAH75919.1 hypothetical protein BO86DRAFT_44761 [Aspergillus japonicus CBS 114.51]
MCFGVFLACFLCFVTCFLLSSAFSFLFISSSSLGSHWDWKDIGIWDLGRKTGVEGTAGRLPIYGRDWISPKLYTPGTTTWQRLLLQLQRLQRLTITICG